MSQAAKPSDDRPSNGNAPAVEDRAAGETASSTKRGRRSTTAGWRTARIHGGRGLLRLRRIKTSSWVTAAGMFLIAWALVLNYRQHFDSTKQATDGDQIDHLAAGAELGSVQLGSADADIQQVEFLSDAAPTPDSALLPVDTDDSGEGPAFPGAAKHHDGPVWLLGTIETESPQEADTP